jgi:hypothetical protein
VLSFTNVGQIRGKKGGRELLPVYQAGWSGRQMPRQFVPVRNFEPRLFVPMPGNMGRPAFTFINLYIFCNLQRAVKYRTNEFNNVELR